MNYHNIVKLIKNDYRQRRLRIIFSIPAFVLITSVFLLPNIFNPEQVDPDLLEKVLNDVVKNLPNGISDDMLMLLMLDLNLPFIVLLPSFLTPLFISTDSILEEKYNRTLENLFVLPLTDIEILFGKMALSILAGITTSWGVHISYLIILLLSSSQIVANYLMNLKCILISLLIVPAVAFFSNTIGLILSCVCTKIKTAHLSGFFIISPFFIIFYIISLGLIIVSIKFLILTFITINILNFMIFRVAQRLFNKERILLKY